MEDLTQLPNIGKVLARCLEEIGVSTYDQLREMGAEEAFLRIRMRDDSACLHKLYGLEGAIQGVRYPQLTKETKERLNNFFNQL